MVTAPLAALLLAAGAGAGAAAPPPAAVPFLRDLTLALPPGGRTTVRLLVPPLSEADEARLAPGTPRFAVGPGDAVWLGFEPGVLVQATRGFRFRPGVAIADLAFPEGGGLLVSTDDALGFLVAEPPAPGSQAGRVTFQPISALPVAGARLSAAAGGGIYLYGPAREGGGHAVYLLAPEPAGTGPGAPRALRTIRRVFSTTERIAAVAGDGATTWVATGKLVLRVTAGGQRVAPVLLHPREPITGLAMTSRGRLFYATASGAGLAAPTGAVEFVKAPGLTLRAAGDALYLLLRGSLAVIKVDGTQAMGGPAARNP